MIFFSLKSFVFSCPELLRIFIIEQKKDVLVHKLNKLESTFLGNAHLALLLRINRTLEGIGKF